MTRSFFSFLLLVMVPAYLVSAEPNTGPVTNPEPTGPAQEASTWMTTEQIVSTLAEDSLVKKTLGAFHLYKQPRINEPTLAGPLYQAWCGALRHDKLIVERCMRRLGKPMADHLIGEYKKFKPGDHYIHGALGVMGEEVKSLAPQLAQNILQGKLRNESINLLAKFRADALPYAKKFLAHNDHIVRSSGMTLMEELGSEAAGEWRLVVQVEMQDKSSIPYYGLRALAAMGPSARGSLPWVTKCLDHHRKETREQALVTLSRISPDDRRPAAALNKQITDANPETRRLALGLLWKGSFSPIVVEKVLSRAVKDPDDSVQDAALFAMERLGTSLPGLYELVSPIADGILQKSNKNMQRRLLEVISLSGPKGADWLAEFLVKSIATKNYYELIEEVPALLRKMGTQAAHVIPKIESAIQAAPYPHQKDALSSTIFILRHADWPVSQKP